MFFFEQMPPIKDTRCTIMPLIFPSLQQPFKILRRYLHISSHHKIGPCINTDTQVPRRPGKPPHAQSHLHRSSRRQLIKHQPHQTPAQKPYCNQPRQPTSLNQIGHPAHPKHQASTSSTPTITSTVEAAKHAIIILRTPVGRPVLSRGLSAATPRGRSLSQWTSVPAQYPSNDFTFSGKKY